MAWRALRREMQCNKVSTRTQHSSTADPASPESTGTRPRACLPRPDAPPRHERALLTGVHSSRLLRPVLFPYVPSGHLNTSEKSPVACRGARTCRWDRKQPTSDPEETTGVNQGPATTQAAAANLEGPWSPRARHYVGGGVNRGQKSSHSRKLK